MSFSCEDCNESFVSQRNLDYHRKNKVCFREQKKFNCKHCDKKFTTKISMYRHIRTSCKTKKKEDQEKNKMNEFFSEKKKSEIYEQLLKLEEDNEKLKEDNEKLKEKDKIIEDLRNVVEQFKSNKASDTQTINNTNNANTTNNTNTTNNVNINNGVQNIVLIGYGKEDLSKIDKDELISCFRSGFQSSMKLTDVLHFNPKYPEYHNVYIKSMKNRYGMIYDGQNWNLILKNDLIDKIYNKNMYYIEDNLDSFCDSLSDDQVRALHRWLDIEDDDDERIQTIKDSIKLSLYNKRRIPIETTKKIGLNEQKLIKSKKLIKPDKSKKLIKPNKINKSKKLIKPNKTN